ncbi:MAG TPA: hypothetical protein ENJ64_04330, partial [Thiotrichales bacterium]|nr:hypothetical protein [Thiotrichales bacterium]
MKKLVIFNTLLLSLLSTGLQAAPVSVGDIHDIYVADKLLGYSGSGACDSETNQSNCDFLAPSPTVFLNTTLLAPIVTGNPASYVLSPFRNSAYIDLGFNDVDLYNGENEDLVVFIVGNATSFGLD